MARIAIIFGLLLCGLTIAGLSLTTEKSYTQFVPMMFGIPSLFLGVVALNPHRRPAATWFAFGVAATAVLMGTVRLVVFAMEWSQGSFINELSFQLVASMTVLSGLFCVVAFLWQQNRKKSIALVENSSVEIVADETDISSSADREPAPDPSNPYQTPPCVDDRGNGESSALKSQTHSSIPMATSQESS